MRTAKAGEGVDKDREVAAEAWSRIAESLARSHSPDDRSLADHVDRFLSSAFAVDAKRRLEERQEPQRNTQPVRQISTVVTKDRAGPDISR